MPAGRRVRGAVTVPPSKSLTHRHLALALLAGRPCVIERPLLAADTQRFLEVLRTLGWQVEESDHRVAVAPGRLPPAARLECGESGTLLRFLVALLATLPGEWVVAGAPRLHERPVGPLVAALAELGASIRWLGANGFPPLAITGGTLVGGESTVDAGESSQYLSALLLAGLAARQPVRLRVTALTSAPYVAVTVAAMRAWSGRVEATGDGYRVTPGPLSLPRRLRIEGDWSAAAYPAAAAVLTGGRVRLAGLAADSAQGDEAILEVLRQMGGTASWDGSELTVAAGMPLRAVDLDLSGMPDQVPTVAALAPFARGTTRIRNVPHLRLKESDRLAAMAHELGRLGASVQEQRGGLTIPGVWAENEPPSAAVTVESWGDHRIAMSLALVGLRRPGVTVADPQVVAKSYPAFWADLEALLSS
ncbi:MAG TPA: 3-phosphoshikimate 1-carboxyvinyltransferase [Thermoanaerobaculia bacterium]|nr:3-phosphoshikimate 1-carboxyvinyltransferase [Thermoanaerobaculia bacterium]